MPTVVSQSTLDELARLINDACDKGDNVSAIAKRSGVAREHISRIRNATYPSSPTIETAEAILQSLGFTLTVSKASR